MESYYETGSFKYEDENFKMKRVQGNSTPPQDLLVYDSMSHLVPILSDRTLPQKTNNFLSSKVLHLTGSEVARFFTSPAQNNPMGISSGFAPARENSPITNKTYRNTLAYARAWNNYQSHIDW
jgi:hypothetical protein